MTTHRFDSLMTPGGAALLAEYAGVPHLEVAVRSKNPALATAVKYLQRAAAKLPLWSENLCLIDAELYEQCSSQSAAVAKFSDISTEIESGKLGGELAVDLTCGLGVDSWALSRLFKHVVSVEINPDKAVVTAHNFAKLGVENISLENQSAEDFVAQMAAENRRCNLIYIDPSRVSADGKKVYALEDSKPNIIELLPQLCGLSSRIIIKLSPLFDTQECWRVFGPTAGVTVLSCEGECKELLVDLSNTTDNSTQNTVNHIVIRNQKIHKITLPTLDKAPTTNPEITLPTHLLIPDVAFYKARTSTQYFRQIAPPTTPFHAEHYIYSMAPVAKFLGSQFSISEIHPYAPKTLKKLLKTKGITTATILLRGFYKTLPQIKKELNLRDGNQQILAFTTLHQKPVAMLIKPTQ